MSVPICSAFLFLQHFLYFVCVLSICSMCVVKFMKMFFVVVVFLFAGVIKFAAH